MLDESVRILTYANEWIAKLPLAELLLRDAVIVLAGSSQISARDALSDWDFHFIISDHLYANFEQIEGPLPVLDDHDHVPQTFGLFRKKSWLEHRFQENANLYLWIYRNALALADPGKYLSVLLKTASDNFSATLKERVRNHYVLYRAARHGLSSCTKRKNSIAERLTLSESIRLGLETVSLAMGQPYPYIKWLNWHVSELGESGLTSVRLAENALSSTPGEEALARESIFKNHVVHLVKVQWGDELWVNEWWRFLQN